MSELARRLRKLLSRLEGTTAQRIGRVGVSSTTWYNNTSGKCLPDAKTIDMYCVACGASEDERAELLQLAAQERGERDVHDYLARANASRDATRDATQ